LDRHMHSLQAMGQVDIDDYSLHCWYNMALELIERKTKLEHV